MMDAEMQNLILAMTAEIVMDRHKGFPWYQPFIASTAQAEAAWNELPITYSWNEIVTTDNQVSFTVSANGGRVAQMLERRMPRSHPAFTTTRDTIVNLLAETRGQMLRELCTEFGLSPSGLSARLSEPG